MRHHSRPPSIAFAALLWLCCASALAQVPRGLPAQAVPAYQQLQRATGSSAWEVQWDAAHAQVQAMRGRSSALDRDPEQAARRFLRGAAPLLELEPGQHDLVLARRKHSPAGTHLQFAQSWRGLPVFGGGIDVHVSPKGEVFLLHNRYTRAPALAVLPQVPLVSAQAAVAAADSVRHDKIDKAGRAQVAAPGKLAARASALAARAELGVQRGRSGLELAWRFTADGFRFVVSATTAQVLARIPLAQSVNGTARVFDPNPVNTLNDTTLRDQGNANYPALQAAYFTRTVQGIEVLSNPVRYRLRGPYVRAFDATASFFANSNCDADGSVVAQPPPIRTDTAFAYFRNQAGFEHAMVYLHIDRSQRYIRSIGFLDNLGSGLPVDAHAFTADNSFFCPGGGTGYIVFGNGFVDDAEDADVVLHEYAHALQDDASGGRYGGDGESGAMGEGFGDYWAYASKPAGFKPACFAEWDVDNGGCLRRLDRNKVYPDDYVDEVHDDGEIWSRALRDLYLALGKPVANKIILQSHYLVPFDPFFDEGAQALLDADDALFGGTHASAICTATLARGFLAPGC